MNSFNDSMKPKDHQSLAYHKTVTITNGAEIKFSYIFIHLIVFSFIVRVSRSSVESVTSLHRRSSCVHLKYCLLSRLFIRSISRHDKSFDQKVTWRFFLSDRRASEKSLVKYINVL